MEGKEEGLSWQPTEADTTLPNVEVIRRAIDGDKEAFSKLFQSTYRRMFFVARHILSRDEDIYDALQIAYSKAYKYIRHVSPPENFYSWLTKIVENSAKDVYRDLHLGEEVSMDMEGSPVPDGTEDSDRRVLVARALKEMDPHRAEVLTLYYYDRLKLFEIAERLGEPISTVHSRLKAAKRELTDLLAQRGIDRSFYSGGFFSAIAVALRSVLGTNILSAAVAQKMMDEVMTGKPGRLDVAAAKLAERQRNKAILRIAGVLLLFVTFITLTILALAGGWFIRREKTAGAPTAPTTTMFGVVSDGTTTTASTTEPSVTDATTIDGSETTAMLPTNGGTTTVPSETTGVTTPSASVTTKTAGTGSTASTTTTRPTTPNSQSTTKPTTTPSTTTTSATKTTASTTTTTTKATTTTTTRPTTAAKDITDSLSYAVVGGKAIITDCDNDVSGAVSIPAYLGGVPVDTLSSSAFSECTEITSIVLPNTLTTIGARAFEDCHSLKEIVIPDGVTAIEADTFNCCYSLESIVVGKGVRKFDSYALTGCSSLESITVRSGNATYHSAGNCLIQTAKKKLIAGSLNSVIPDDGSVTTIGTVAFQWFNSGIQTLTIPESITLIEQMAFSDVENLYIPDLKAWCGITFEEGGSNPMQYAKNIYIEGSKARGKVTIPRGITTIKAYAFVGCTMAQVELLEGVTTLEYQAFSDCEQLAAVILPKSLKKVHYHAFNRSEKLSIVEYAGSASDRAAIDGLADCTELKKATWTYN